MLWFGWPGRKLVCELARADASGTRLFSGCDLAAVSEKACLVSSRQ
jgi:hypothetical protein